MSVSQITIAVSIFLAMAGLGYGNYEAYRFQKYLADEAIAKAEKEKQMADDVFKIRNEKDAKIKSLNVDLANALVSLRNRPSRTELSKDGKGCNGATLPAEDAEFLTREAARADEMRIALEACYKQYDSL